MTWPDAIRKATEILRDFRGRFSEKDVRLILRALSRLYHQKPNMKFITVQNLGPELESTNYWESDLAAAGYLYLSCNAGALRLLIPPSKVSDIAEMITAREVIVTRGVHRQHQRPMVELLFDDHSSNPYVLFLSLEQVERGFADAGDLPRRFLLYTQGPRLAGELIWYYREAQLPCLRRLT